jgi:hypothetical protein
MAKHTDRYYQDLKRHKGYKHPIWGVMSFHHFGYAHLKNRYSIDRIDGVYLPKWFHVPVIHILLGGGSRAGSQLFGKFPNLLQRVAHWLCRVHFALVPMAIAYCIYQGYLLYFSVR